MQEVNVQVAVRVGLQLLIYVMSILRLFWQTEKFFFICPMPLLTGLVVTKIDCSAAAWESLHFVCF